MDDLFTGGDWFTSDLGRYRYVPSSESYVKDGRLYLRTELPGVDPKDVDVSVHDIHLCISGVRKIPEGAKGADFCFDEMSYGSFERRFHIPRGSLVDKIDAKFDSGVLEITIPLGKSTVKKVPIDRQEGTYRIGWKDEKKSSEGSHLKPL
jgi:HSP20 family protein